MKQNRIKAGKAADKNADSDYGSEGEEEDMMDKMATKFKSFFGKKDKGKDLELKQ